MQTKETMKKFLLLTCLIISSQISLCLDPAMAMLLPEQNTQKTTYESDTKTALAAVVARVRAKINEFQKLISETIRKKESQEKN